jgi:hypothetical protein
VVLLVILKGTLARRCKAGVGDLHELEVAAHGLLAELARRLRE